MLGINAQDDRPLSRVAEQLRGQTPHESLSSEIVDIESSRIGLGSDLKFQLLRLLVGECVHHEISDVDHLRGLRLIQSANVLQLSHPALESLRLKPRLDLFLT